VLNKALLKQTLVLISLAAGPGSADPPGAFVPPVRSFQDWRLDCHARHCTAETRVAGADGSTVLTLGVARDGTVAVTTPLPLHLPAGLTLSLGDAPPRSVPWRTCDARGCEATLAPDPNLLAALRRQRAGAATFTLVDGVEVRLPLSLLGATAALRAQAAVSPGP
jgi:invasion protein IalB